jgi:hypothetical protein
MKKMLPYLIGIVVIGAIGFFVYKKFVQSRLPMSSVGKAGTDSSKLLSAAAAAAPKKRSGGWRSKIGGFAKSVGGAASGAASSALSNPGLASALTTALSK